MNKRENIKEVLGTRKAYTKHMLGLKDDEELSVFSIPTVLWRVLRGNNKEAISFALDMTYFVSEIKQTLQWVVTGVDYPTGEVLTPQRRVLQSVAWTSRLLFYVLGWKTALEIHKNGIEPNDYYMFLVLMALYATGPLAYRSNYYKKLQEFAIRQMEE